MSLAVLANHIADKGRHGDSMLVHMSPQEVAALQDLAQAHGYELTINPETGLPEAFSLKGLLPVLAGAALNFFAPGVGSAIGAALGGLSTAAGSAIAVGGIASLATGSLEKGLMAGLGAYGGAGLTDALLAGGAGAAGAAGALGVPGAATGAGSQAAMLAEQTAGFGAEGLKSLADSAAYAKGAAPSLGAALTAGAQAAKDAPLAFAKNNYGLLAAAATPVLADAMVPTTTKMPTQGQTAPYIRPMIIDRRQVANPQFVPGTGSSERNWFETRYEVPPPIHAITGKQVASSAATPTTVYPPSPYDQPEYSGGGYAPGGLVSFADGGEADDPQRAAMRAAGIPVDVPLISHQPYQVAGAPQEKVTLPAAPGLAALRPAPALASSTATFGAPIKPMVGNANFTAAPAPANKMTGASRRAFDYLMGNVAAAPAPAPAPAEQPSRTNPVERPVVRTPVDTGPVTGGAPEQVVPSIERPVVEPFVPFEQPPKEIVDPEAPPVDEDQENVDQIEKARELGDEEEQDQAQQELEHTLDEEENVRDIEQEQADQENVEQLQQAQEIADQEEQDQAQQELEHTLDEEENVRDIEHQQDEQENLDQIQQAQEAEPVDTTDYYPPTDDIAPTTWDTTPDDFQSTQGPAVPLDSSDDGSVLPYIPGPARDVSPTEQEPVDTTDYYPPTEQEPVEAAPVYEQPNPYEQAVEALYGGYDTGGYDMGGYDTGGYDTGGYDMGGYDASGGGTGTFATHGDVYDTMQVARGGLLHPHMAQGGLPALTQRFNLGGYSDGGRLLRGPGDGVSDSIPATIGHSRQPARLADGEFVIPARIVSELGNGSTEAGARQLYAMMDRIQKARSKTVGKGHVAKDTRANKYLPA